MPSSSILLHLYPTKTISRRLMMMASLNLHLVNEARKVAIMVYPSPYEGTSFLQSLAGSQ